MTEIEKKKRIDELKKQMAQVRDRCSIWLSSTDGSHGACMHHNGFAELKEELIKLGGDDDRQVR